MQTSSALRHHAGQPGSQAGEHGHQGDDQHIDADAPQQVGEHLVDVHIHDTAGGDQAQTHRGRQTAQAQGQAHEHAEVDGVDAHGGGDGQQDGGDQHDDGDDLQEAAEDEHDDEGNEELMYYGFYNGREEIEDDCEPIHAKAITLADEELMNIIKGIDNPAN